MPRLFKEERGRAFGMLTVGGSQKGVARQFEYTFAVIYRLETRFKPTRASLDRQSSSCSSVITIALKHQRLRVQRLRE